jgi:hypothetical protein
MSDPKPAPDPDVTQPTTPSYGLLIAGGVVGPRPSPPTKDESKK